MANPDDGRHSPFYSVGCRGIAVETLHNEMSSRLTNIRSIDVVGQQRGNCERFLVGIMVGVTNTFINWCFKSQLQSSQVKCSPLDYINELII